METIEDSCLAITPVSQLEKGVIATLKDFDCSDSFLNNYARKKLVKNDEKNLAKGFVATIDDIIVGYITTKVTSLDREHFQQKGLPHAVPTLSIEQVATDINHRNKKLGTKLTRRAFEIAVAISKNAGIKGISLWAHPDALVFYRKLGFEKLATKVENNSLELTLMFLPIETIQKSMD